MVTIQGKVRDIRELFRKVEKKARLKLSSGSSKIKKVDEVGITPTMKCSLDCGMCHQGQIKDWENMSFESFKKIVVGLKKSGVTKVSLVGGEIFVHKDMWKFIDLLESMNFKYDLSSNLFYVPNFEKLIKLKNLEMVTTSIDGLGELHNKIRRGKNAFERTMGYIDKLVKAKIFVDVACVVQKANFNDLEKIVEYLCKKKIGRITLIMENSVTEKEKVNTQRIVKAITGKESQIIVTSLKNPLGTLDEKDFEKIPQKMEKIRKIVKKYDIKFGSTIQMDDPKVLDKSKPLKEYGCSLFSGYGMTVYSDNSIHQCCFMKLKNKNDITKESALKVVNSQAYTQIRDHFQKYGAFEMCRMCCALKKK